MQTDTDILITGGGLNGPVLALALARHGHRVTIIDTLAGENRGDAGFDGRAYALALASKRLLAGIGIWGRIAGDAQPMLDIVITDGHAGTGPAPFVLHFDHAEIEEGPMGFMVEDRFLRRALLAAMDENPAISQIGGHSVIAQDTGPGRATVTLDDGRTLSARLLIGCDGRRSGTAERAGIGRSGWDYGQTALVCAIAHEYPHHGIAHQVFMPAGPLAILPLPGNLSSIVLSERHATAAAIHGLDDAGYLAALRIRVGDFLGAITLAGPRWHYPLSLSIAGRITAKRLALVGDAAHGMHPIAGQGLNAGLRDIGALSEVLTDAARRGEDIGAAPVLDRYRQWRGFDIATLAATTDLCNRLFSNDNPLLRLGRDLGLGLIGATPALRRAFIREAAGLTGDVPKLLILS